MTYPAAPLQKAIYDCLTGNGALALNMGGTVRAYDRVPPSPVFPYLTIADGTFNDDGDACEGDRYEAFIDLQVWSRAVGNVEAKVIAGAARRAILDGLPISGWAATAIECQGINHFMDPDGLTARARLTFRFLLEPA